MSTDIAQRAHDDVQEVVLHAGAAEIVLGVRSAVRAADEVGKRAVVITSAAEGFCLAGSPADVTGLATALAKLADTIGRARLPVVCVVRGAVRGPGLILLAAADARIGAASCDIALGMSATTEPLHPGLAWQLTRHVSPAAARRLLLLGETLTGPQAHAAGLLDTVVDDEDLEAQVHRMVRQLNAMPLEVIRAVKRSLRRSLHVPQDEAIEYDAWLTVP